MKVSEDKIDTFYDKMSQGKPETFDKNYRMPVLRILKECLDETGDVIKCLKDSDRVIKKVLDTYANVNTRKVYLQALLWFVDNYDGMKTKVPREAYLRAWETSKLAVMETPNKEYADLPSIDEVQAKVDEKYGGGSMESLYISFFKEVPTRLDYQDVKVYKTSTQVPEDAVKYIVYSTKKLIMKEYNILQLQIQLLMY